MLPLTCNFKNFRIKLFGKNKRATGVSRDGQNLSKIIPPLFGLDILDLGCGVGYMTIGALSLGARAVTSLDKGDNKKILFKNLKINHFDSKRVKFLKSDLFLKLSLKNKFDVIIANLPQHALPATVLAKKLEGKYGGFDGTDLVCRAITESVSYLKAGGKYLTTVSMLTNFQRTMDLAKILYKIKIHKTVTKILEGNEMEPYIHDKELFKHLNNLKSKKMIEFKINKQKSIEYKVHLCEFILK